MEEKRRVEVGGGVIENGVGGRLKLSLIQFRYDSYDDKTVVPDFLTVIAKQCTFIARLHRCGRRGAALC